MYFTTRVTSLNIGLSVVVKDRAITTNVAAIDSAVVELAALDVIGQLEQLAEIFKAHGEIKSSNSSMTDLEEVELRMST